METALARRNEFERILQQKQADLAAGLRNRDGIAIEKSADQMDEIQYASERDLAIQNVHNDSTVLREVTGALRRLSDGTFGICVECDAEISAKRLAAVPWASRCIACQDTADGNGRQEARPFNGLLEDAA